jgi:membrane protein insertase Oxa1/YidC/SpoIIIJ
MAENKYITEKEIDYLKHLQEHNMFNYNVKFDWFFHIASTYTPLFLSFALIIIILYYNIPYLNQNFSNGILLGFVTSLILLLVFIILFCFFKTRENIKKIQKGFKKYHAKIKERYKEIGLDIDSLNK